MLAMARLGRCFLLVLHLFASPVSTTWGPFLGRRLRKQQASGGIPVPAAGAVAGEAAIDGERSTAARDINDAVPGRFQIPRRALPVMLASYTDPQSFGKPRMKIQQRPQNLFWSHPRCSRSAVSGAHAGTPGTVEVEAVTFARTMTGGRVGTLLLAVLVCKLCVGASATGAGFVPRHAAELKRTAKLLGAEGKGILAADESTGTIAKRFASIGVENSEKTRRKYREMLFTAPGLEEHISGVIMYDETIGQKTGDGQPFPVHLAEKGILTGIKVDTGVVELPGTSSETSTTGLDSLAKRCALYYTMGARFAKWRAVFRIDQKQGCPSNLAIQDNTWGLARYAAICQSEGLVPIVEPEILMDGPHSIQYCVQITERVLAAVYKALADNHVMIEGTCLKPNMVCPGSDNSEPCSTAEMAFHTISVLRRCVPPAVPTICFLSGGQSEEEATLNLNAMNSVTAVSVPWSLTFSYGRALQASSLKAWGGKEENLDKAAQVFLDRVRANGLATRGMYEAGGAAGAAAESLFIKSDSS